METALKASALKSLLRMYPERGYRRDHFVSRIVCLSLGAVLRHHAAAAVVLTALEAWKWGPGESPEQRLLATAWLQFLSDVPNLTRSLWLSLCEE